MRKGLVVAVLLAIVAMPMAFAGVGFCRAMPCCPPHLAAHSASMQQPDCCNTKNCDRAPDAAGEYTTAKHVHQQTVAPDMVPVAIVSATPAVLAHRVMADASPPLAPPALQRRIATLSVFLI